MITLLYNLFIVFYGWGIRLASLWNPKARLWVQGRKNIFSAIKEAVNNLPKDNVEKVWMHCASLGEFEQGRPLIEQLKKDRPGIVIIITFFSPSGYEIRKNYTGADLIFYLPMDTPANARQFVNLIKPTLVLWIRYEYWFHYLKALKERQVPVLLVSGVFRKGDIFFKSYGRYWRDTLKNFTHFFVQTAESVAMLGTIGFDKNVTLSGDTRFDRVSAIAGAFTPLPEIAGFCSGHKVLVAGSTWTDDEEELTHYVRTNTNIRFIIAPHEVDEENIRDVQKEFPRSVLFSELKKEGVLPFHNSDSVNTLIIDNIGMLSKLYYYADIAYVGGGFGTGLHNILEAAVYGKPVIFGPYYQDHYEAIEMEATGGATSIENALELETVLNNLWNNPEKLQKSGEAAQQYIRSNTGATGKIMDYIQRNRLFTN
ncbi:MAG: 3-deoxy-D-manno-octulosonic acid transferase [Chitinophagaceae bacterium]|nr:3-deoxy-D-manno-octulosonic acid transferase [Chitinophagaceae bacterium]